MSSDLVRGVRGVSATSTDMSVRHPLRRRGTADNGQRTEPSGSSGPLDVATSTAAFELVRTALVAKLAVDLGDPVLARRAARYARSSAQLLAGLVDFPPHDDREEPDDQALPEVEDLLERLPSRHDVKEASA